MGTAREKLTTANAVHATANAANAAQKSGFRYMACSVRCWNSITPAARGAA